jgi:hypothetical protein
LVTLEAVRETHGRGGDARGGKVGGRQVTLKELDELLPNGFHDAWFKRIDIDYPARRVSIELDVSIGLPDDPPEKRDRLRGATLVLEGLEFVSIGEPPAGYPENFRGRLQVDLGESKPPVGLRVPKDCFYGAFFASELNAEIAIVAREATLEWAHG